MVPTAMIFGAPPKRQTWQYSSPESQLTMSNAAKRMPTSRPLATVRAAVASADAVLVVAPEYNGSLPAVLKNAIDWLSRPYGRGALVDKPVGIMSASSARGGGERMRVDAVKAIGIAGGRVVEEVRVGLRASEVGALGEVDEAIVSQVTGAIEVLVDAVDASVGV